jgi:hypothetical protein
VRSKHYSTGTIFPFMDGADTKVLPECTPTCGQNRQDATGFPSIEAMPAGTCDQDRACDFGAYVPASCDLANGPVNIYRCSCSNGEWSCAIISQGGSVVLCDVDAGR